jgi:hypothetical protein
MTSSSRVVSVKVWFSFAAVLARLIRRERLLLEF